MQSVLGIFFHTPWF